MTTTLASPTSAPTRPRWRRASPAVQHRRRTVLAQMHVSAALLLAAPVLGSAAFHPVEHGRWTTWLTVFLATAAVVAAAQAVKPWLLSDFMPGHQRLGIWTAFVLSVAPAGFAVTGSGLSAVGASQLLLLAAVLAEVGHRPRVLLALWGVAGAVGGIVMGVRFWMHG